MLEMTQEERYQACREAIRGRVCAVCLDAADDGSCGLVDDRACAIESYLPRLVETMLSVKSTRMDEYFSALEAEVCSRCRELEADGNCRLRERGTCGLSVYLPLVVEAIEEVGSSENPAP